ncbi:hypothetical protein NDU88_003867 [Pleurodeles waltl]|uniref:Uncharacterized protein n=1 Tax=Pleurodeles waltl TaxID=8319 RepID=A0AAV7RGE2_PLEWA|nr:hypothetical protein NDU88_003867 [Pleurodeles waltl]
MRATQRNRDTAKRYSPQEPSDAKPESAVPVNAHQHPCHQQEVRQARCLQLSPHAYQLPSWPGDEESRRPTTGTGPSAHNWRARQPDCNILEDEFQQDEATAYQEARTTAMKGLRSGH